MADKIGEQLSALMDSECEAVEVELALRRLAKDADLRARWQRYHLISDAMKNNIPEMLDADFAKRISSKISADPPPRKPAYLTAYLLGTSLSRVLR